ncbi:MAG: hypothetical protein K2R98_17760 [Gemmataceae bacterium]|nr:hypothetical protein [Gemmataceae bacterium]
MPPATTPRAVHGLGRRVLVYGPRLVLMAAVVAVAIYTLTIYGDLLHGPEPPRPVAPPPPQPEPSVASLIAGMPLDGTWVFEGRPWQVRVSRVAAEQVPEAFARPLPASIPAGPAADWERIVIAAARFHCPKPRGEKDRLAYVVERPEVRAILVTSRQGPSERVAAGRLALRNDGDQWNVVEIEPGRGAVPVQAGDTGLLPSAARVRRLARREDQGGTVLGEVVSTRLSMDALRQAWRQAGWAVTEPDGRLGPTLLVCRRGSEAVQIIGFPSSTDTGEMILLLVRIGAPVP